MYTLYRDDDISVTSDIQLLMEVHDLFVKHGKIHTVAVLVKDIWENKEVWYWLMTSSNLRIGLHGWDHKDYGRAGYSEIQSDIQRCLEYLHDKAKKGKYESPYVDTFYPPWNSVGPDLSKICQLYGLQCDARIGPPVFNFHYWACQDKKHMDALEEALKQ